MKAMTTGIPNAAGQADLKQQFRDLLQASGWSQAEAARQLAMSPSALSQIVRRNSPVRPSPVTLRLFKLLLWRERPEAMREAAGDTTPPESELWERELVLALRAIPPEARQTILNRLAAMILAAQESAREVPQPAEAIKIKMSWD